MGRRLGHDGVAGLALFHLRLQALQCRGHAQHPLEGVDALMLEPDVGGFALDGDAQGDGAPVRVPDDAAGGFGREHRHGVLPEQAELVEVRGPAAAAGFLIRHQAQADAAPQGYLQLLEQVRGVDHGRQARLHVGRAAAVEASVPDNGVELLTALRGHHVVVPVEVQGALPSPVEAEDVVTGASVMNRCLYLPMVEPEAVQLPVNAVRAFAVVIARRILTGNANEVLAKSQDGVFVNLEGLRQGEL